MRAALRNSFMYLLAPAVLVLGLTVSVQAADREKLLDYLDVTGFGVALESIRLSADNAPAMLGIEADAFGSEWSRLVDDVFAKDIMQEMALNILGETLTDDLLTHAADFYATDLGQRLVAAENDSHMENEEGLKSESGEAILEGLRGIDSPRVGLLERLVAASGSQDSSISALQEIQVRFLMAAAGAGVIELRLEEPDLREMLRAQTEEMRETIAENALVSAAYTYQAFSNEEIETYAEALEDPRMQEVYELMNAVQYEIMANRFEVVAERLAEMQPSTDL